MIQSQTLRRDSLNAVKVRPHVMVSNIPDLGSTLEMPRPFSSPVCHAYLGCSPPGLSNSDLSLYLLHLHPNFSQSLPFLILSVCTFFYPTLAVLITLLCHSFFFSITRACARRPSLRPAVLPACAADSTSTPFTT